MKLLLKLIFLKIVFLLNFLFLNVSNAENHNIYETLEIIKNDLKTLERAVYSGSIEIKQNTTNASNLNTDINSEDVLTRHLLKLSEVEDQFRELTNKFEEINFKLDKLSNRLTKIQTDNQVRFEEIDAELVSINSNYNSNGSNQLSLKPKVKENKMLPGSSQPQLLGTITYKDTETSDTTQKIDSVESTASVVMEKFETEEKILPQDISIEKQYEFATSFLQVGDYAIAERAFREFVNSLN
jgi:TolA-binding protein